MNKCEWCCYSKNITITKLVPIENDNKSLFTWFRDDKNIELEQKFVCSYKKN